MVRRSTETRSMGSLSLSRIDRDPRSPNPRRNDHMINLESRSEEENWISLIWIHFKVFKEVVF